MKPGTCRDACVRAIRRETILLTYRGRWRVTVTGKDSGWDQRVVISGASSGAAAMAGVIGSSQDVDGDSWTLTIEHNPGTGWVENEAVVADAMQEIGADMRQVVRSKDHFTPGDDDPNDLVIRLDKIGPMFELPLRPYAVDADSLLMLADGVFIGLSGEQYMGVEVRNTWGEAFEDELLFDISDLGRATLATFGISVDDTWTQGALAATDQTVTGRSIRLPQLEIGQSTTVYFQVDAGAARRGKPDVEFVLLNTAGTPDPGNAVRHNSRAIFIADVAYDSTSGQAIVNVPEGRLTLRLQSLMVDQRAIAELCRNLVRSVRSPSGGTTSQREIGRLMSAARSQYCDQATLRELLDILSRCLCDGKDGGGGKGWQRLCSPGGMWLPLRFEYSVEVNGGFTGQYGPLPYQDPWWKVVLLIIAIIAWLVGVIASIVADLTGWGNTGDHPRRIGTVGASNRSATDACIIELDGSRPAIQKVADVITGETNNQPIIGLDTVIPIDPQVAFPVLTSAAVVGKLVYKSGSRTGLTHGIITGFGPFTQSRGNNGTPDPNHPDLVFTNDQFSISADPAFGEELFDDHGDSGSPVLSREPSSMNQVVGLLHSGNGGTSPIQDVLATMALRLR